jgi:hypothetical protein
MNVFCYSHPGGDADYMDIGSQFCAIKALGKQIADPL